MTKKLLFFVLLIPFSGFCQNFQCLQAGVKHYFTNSNGYLRGIRIDSVRTMGDTTVYFPFHTPRGSYSPGRGASAIFNADSGSWLGKKVTQLVDGTFLFDNLWHDTLVIKTQANLGDSWIFFRDTSSVHYMAQLITIDTATVLGILDSVKTINITAYSDTGFLPSDPLNNMKIQLSKNNGFLQVFDLFTFPYPMPGYDYYLDNAISAPIAETSEFNLINFVNPTYAQLYNWDIGDVFENTVCSPEVSSTGIYPYQFYVDTITSKTITASGVLYDYSGWAATQRLPIGPALGTDNVYSYKLISRSGSFFVSNKLLIDSNRMPEETGQKMFYYYYPADTGICNEGYTYYYHTSYLENQYLSIPIEGEGPFFRYRTGVGLVRYWQGALELSPTMLIDTSLLYYFKSGIGCGTYTVPGPLVTSVAPLSKSGFINVFPNPATEELTIKTSLTQPYTMTLRNMLGEILQTRSCTAQEQTINVSALPAGIYNVSITDNAGNRYNERVVVAPR